MINGGPPLSGEITAAGNKNAALPILAACLLTEEELVLAQRAADPRHRGAGRRCSRGSASRPTGATTRAAPAAPTRSPARPPTRTLSTRDPRLVPARRPAAGALRRGADAAARRRLHRPPPARPAPRRLHGPRRPDRGRPRDRASRAPDGGLQAVRDLHGRAVGDGDRERADGRRADARADDDLQRRLRAARPGPRRAAGEDGRPDRRDRLERDDRPRARQARRRRARDLPRPHRGRQLHGARRGDQAASCGSATPSPTT